MYEFPEFTLGFRLFTASLYAWLFIILTPLQLLLDTIHLQFFLQQSNGMLNVTFYFYFNHIISSSA